MPEMQRRWKLIGVAIASLLLYSCATYRAEFQKQWLPIQTTGSDQCPDISGEYPDIPESPPDQPAYATNYDPFRLHWLILSAPKDSQNKQIRNVIISMTTTEISFNFINPSRETVAVKTYQQGQYLCKANQLIIGHRENQFRESSIANVQQSQLNFSLGFNKLLLLKLTVMKRGLAMLIIPYNVHEEYVYRFKRLGSL